MGLRINNNIAAMNAYRNLSVTDGQMAKSLEKLSSGFRINRAADDAAGLTVPAADIAGRRATGAPSPGGAPPKTPLGDTEIASVSTKPPTPGAPQNRLEHTINSLNVAAENLSASESRVRDTDMAEEM